MTPSLSEITSTSYKAARGAGFSWGLADEAGRATAWLWEHGIEGPAVLAHLLDKHETGCASETCAIQTGTRFCDAPPFETLVLDSVNSPNLLLSFLAELAKITEKPYTMTFGEAHYSASPAGMFCANHEIRKCAQVTVRLAAPKGEKLVPLPRRPVDATTWARLKYFAHRTCAPATEASRLAGAGAGLSDND